MPRASALWSVGITALNPLAMACQQRVQAQVFLRQKLELRSVGARGTLSTMHPPRFCAGPLVVLAFVLLTSPALAGGGGGGGGVATVSIPWLSMPFFWAVNIGTAIAAWRMRR
jgi:hypothetical protein